MPQDTRDTRTELLQQALRLFAARGYDAVGVQEIVEAVGVTKPTLYHYFSSKRGLLDALLQQHFDALYERTRLAADYHGDLPLTLQQVVAAYFAFAREHPTFYRLQLALWFAPPQSDSFKAVSRWMEWQHTLMEALFIRAAEDHGNMKDRHQRYAATLIGTINTYISLFLNDYSNLDDTVLYQAVHQFMYGIFS